ncbi:MAG: ABC transporter permease, partial [Oscillospiraceae bacterium]|nr:ABC transporter permease [Oscillospiraceae bacterium]
MRGNFDNTIRLVRFMLKRERFIAAVWIVILVLFSASLAPGLEAMFAEEGAREQIAGIFDNPVMVSIMGQAYGDSTGALYSAMMLVWYLIAVAVMNVFLIIRHTRADEESGRAEVVRSLPVGRLAGINAAMITAVVINAILAVATGIGIAVTGTPSMDFAGCMLYGAVSGAVGLVFAAVTLVFCQLSQSTSGAAGLSFLTLGVFYMMRAYGDRDPDFEFFSFISPLGLAGQSKIFVDNSLLPFLALLIIAVVIAVPAYKLNSMRDLGQGFIPAKPGRSTAAKSLLSPFGLSFRLLRKSMIIWLIIMFSAGASYGTIINDIGSYVSSMPKYLEIIGLPQEVIESLTDEQMTEITEEYADMIVEYFGVFITSMMTLIALIPVLIAAMKLRAEEKEGRVEHVISRSVSKMKYLCGFTLIAFVSSVF